MEYQWEQITEARGYDIFPGMDPAANWLILGPGSSAFFQFIPEEQAHAIESHREAKASRSALLPSMFQNISVPVVFDIPDESFGDPNVLKVSSALNVSTSRNSSRYFFTTPVLLDSLFDNDVGLFGKSNFRQSFASSKASYKLCAPINGDAAEDVIFADGPAPVEPRDGWHEDSVIMAVIDDGLGFANSVFRDADNQTRFQYLWWQDPTTTASAGVSFGKEIGKQGIDDLIADAVGGSTDADIYQAFGTMDFNRDRRSTVALGLTHGTHVLDVAAGYSPGEDPGTRPIIGVQLWQEAVERGTGAELEFYILAAVEYILLRAGQISDSVGRKLPVVINLSYGFNLGPHDGTSQFEKNLSKLIQSYEGEGTGASIVISSGNNHLTQTYSEIAFNSMVPVQPTELKWQVLPEDRTSTVMEIWLPYSQEVEEKNTNLEPEQPRHIDDRFVFSVTTPSGVTSPPIQCQHGTGVVLNVVEDGEVYQIAEAKYCFVPGNTCRGMVRISLTPTAQLAAENGPWADTKVSPAGIWTVAVARKAYTSDEIAAGTEEKINTWILRDDEVYGYPLEGQQSYFVNECYEVYDSQGREIVEDTGGGCPVRRKSLINAAATGDDVHVVGAYYEREREQTEYSAGGPKIGAKDEAVNPAVTRKPDLLAAAEGSRVHYGVLASGSMSGSIRPMGGTSVAAPMYARKLADELANAISPDAAKNLVKSNLHSAPGITDQRGGFGLLEPEHRVKPKRFETDDVTFPA